MLTREGPVRFSAVVSPLISTVAVFVLSGPAPLKLEQCRLRRRSRFRRSRFRPAVAQSIEKRGGVPRVRDRERHRGRSAVALRRGAGVTRGDRDVVERGCRTPAASACRARRRRAATIVPTTRSERDVLRVISRSLRPENARPVLAGTSVHRMSLRRGYRRVTSRNGCETVGRNTYPISGTDRGSLARRAGASNCSVARCASWIWAVTSDGIRIAISARRGELPARPARQREQRRDPSRTRVRLPR